MVRPESRGRLALSGIPDTVAILGDRLERTAALDAERIVHDDGVATMRHRRLVALFDQEPIRAPLAGGLAAHPYQRPVALQFLTAQLEFEHPLGEGRGRVGIGGDPSAAVPQQHGAAAILPSRNNALEPAIVERVVLNRDGEPFFAGVETRAFWHRPAL